MGLGRDRRVYAKRLLFVYAPGQVCVYPAQNLDDLKKTDFDDDDFYTQITSNGAKYVIERNRDDYFSSSDNDSEKFITFWGPLKDADGSAVGAIGLQLS